jgi:hypothetical protein
MNTNSIVKKGTALMFLLMKSNHIATWRKYETPYKECRGQAKEADRNIVCCTQDRKSRRAFKYEPGQQKAIHIICLEYLQIAFSTPVDVGFVRRPIWV